MQKIVVYTDGGARGNPGPAAIGIVIFLQGTTSKKIHSFGKKIGIATNNIAEYTAVIEALKWLVENKTRYAKIPVHFYLDSSLVVNQLNGIFKIKKPELMNLFFSIKQIQQQFPVTISYSFIPREKNNQADSLVNKALDQNTIGA